MGIVAVELRVFDRAAEQFLDRRRRKPRDLFGRKHGRRRHGDVVYADLFVLAAFPIHHHGLAVCVQGSRIVGQQVFHGPTLRGQFLVRAQFARRLDEGLERVMHVCDIEGTIGDPERAVLGAIGRAKQHFPVIVLVALLHERDIEPGRFAERGIDLGFEVVAIRLAEVFVPQALCGHAHHADGQAPGIHVDLSFVLALADGRVRLVQELADRIEDALATKTLLGQPLRPRHDVVYVGDPGIGQLGMIGRDNRVERLPGVVVEMVVAVPRRSIGSQRRHQTRRRRTGARDGTCEVKDAIPPTLHIPIRQLDPAARPELVPRLLVLGDQIGLFFRESLPGQSNGCLKNVAGLDIKRRNHGNRLEIPPAGNGQGVLHPLIIQVARHLHVQPGNAVGLANFCIGERLCGDRFQDDRLGRVDQNHIVVCQHANLRHRGFGLVDGGHRASQVEHSLHRRVGRELDLRLALIAGNPDRIEPVLGRFPVDGLSIHFHLGDSLRGERQFNFLRGGRRLLPSGGQDVLAGLVVDVDIIQGIGRAGDLQVQCRRLDRLGQRSPIAGRSPCGPGNLHRGAGPVVCRLELMLSGAADAGPSHTAAGPHRAKPNRGRTTGLRIEMAIARWRTRRTRDRVAGNVHLRHRRITRGIDPGVPDVVLGDPHVEPAVFFPDDAVKIPIAEDQAFGLPVGH